MNYIKNVIKVEEDGLYLVFAVTQDDQLKLMHFSSNPWEGHDERDLFLKEGFQLVQVSFSGYNRPYEKHGNKNIVTAPGYLLKYVSMDEETNEIGKRLVVTQKDEETGASLVGPGQVSRERLDMEQVRPPSPAPTRTL